MLRRMESFDFRLDVREIFRRSGMPADAGRRRSFGPLVETVRRRALEFLEPRTLFMYVPVSVRGPQEVLLAERLSIPASAVFFEGACEVCLGILTIGERLERESARLFQGQEMLEGLFLDACGTVAVDELVAALRREVVEEAARRGWQTGYSLSPGGKQIPLEAQKELFALLPGSEIGVTLLDSWLMQPVKSHSLLIPVGEKLIKANTSCTLTCEMCSAQATCAHNRIRFAQASGDSD